VHRDGDHGGSQREHHRDLGPQHEDDQGRDGESAEADGEDRLERDLRGAVDRCGNGHDAVVPEFATTHRPRGDRSAPDTAAMPGYPPSVAGRIGSFVAELRRRRVFRVAVAYGVAAGGALQLASVVVPALHLPDWTLTMAVLLAGLGFPAAMVLSWTFDLTSAGVVRTPEVAPAHGTQRPAGMAVLVAAALLVAAAAGGAWWWLRSGASPPASREVVAVLPFTVRGSSQFAYLGEGMVDLLGASLSRGGALHTVDSRSLLRYVGREAGELDAERSRGVAAHFGAGLLVLGDVLEVERRLRIHGALYEVAKEGSPVTEATAEGGAGRL